MKKRAFTTFRIGETSEFTQEITEKSVRLFAEIIGDKNPIHLDEEYAEKSMFKSRIAHGILTAGIISSLLTAMCGDGTIYLSTSLRFTKPVYLPSTITAKGKVVDLREDKKFVKIETNCFDQENEMVIKGESLIMVPE